MEADATTQLQAQVLASTEGAKCSSELRADPQQILSPNLRPSFHFLLIAPPTITGLASRIRGLNQRPVKPGISSP